MTLEQQPADHRRLNQHNRESRYHLPAVLVPQARCTKTDFASRWQPALADSEALELAPVEHGPGEIAAGNRNVRSVFAVEDAQCEPRRRLAERDRRRNEATGTAMADVGLCVDDDRPVGHCGEGRETFVRHVGCPRAVVSDTRVYDRRIVRQRSDPLPDLGHRQTEKLDEFKLRREDGDIVLVMVADGLTLPSITHQSDSLQVRHQRLRGGHGIAERELIYRSSYVGREVQSSRGLLVDRGKNHGHPRPQLRARAHHEFKR
jgi:hypothetical protein